MLEEGMGELMLVEYVLVDILVVLDVFIVVVR